MRGYELITNAFDPHVAEQGLVIGFRTDIGFNGTTGALLRRHLRRDP